MFFLKMEVAVMDTAKLNGGNPTADSLETQSIKVLCNNSVLSPNELTVVKKRKLFIILPKWEAVSPTPSPQSFFFFK